MAQAEDSDIPACIDLLDACFGLQTGYMPALWELKSDVKTGSLLCIKGDDGQLCGLLRWVAHPANIEVRLVAVREDVRGQKLSRRLLDAFTHKWGHKQNTIWMNDDNIAAQKAYTAVGFAPDGWRSDVMLCKLTG